jgi:hypothetical protein
VAVAVAGDSLRRVEGGSGSLKCDFDGLELALQVSQVPALHFELVPLAQDLDLLLLDETALFFYLRAFNVLARHSCPPVFIRSEPRSWQGPLRTTR